LPLRPLKTESELRRAVIDRLIAASLNEGKRARETTLERWRAIGTRKTEPTHSAPKAS
jgi:hypothetical protein